MKKEDFTKEELDKCKQSPVYFYNKYVRKEGDKELTEEEFRKFSDHVERLRNNPLKLRRRYAEYPITPDECPDFLHFK